MGNAQSDKSSRSGAEEQGVQKATGTNTAKNNCVNEEENKRPPFLEKVIQDVFNPPPKEEPKPVVRPPKYMLWGCETPEEHYAKINDVCAKAPTLEGEEGLRELGFEFSMVHCPETCICDDGCLTFDNSDDDEYALMDDTLAQQEEYLVPIGVPLEDHKALGLERSMTDLVESTIDRLSHQEDMVDTAGEKSSGLPKRGSNVSLFSLATHYTASTTASSYEPPTAISYHAGGEDEKTCALRLHHITSGGTLVTPENHQEFIAHGKMYDEIARLCMEVAQTEMMKEGQLHWVSVCGARGIEALVSQSKPTSKKVLLIVTGKGQVRAGIFSRRHLITTGVESSTALPLIREAIRRDMEIVMLDPNAKGHSMGMEVVEASLEKLFFDRDEDEEIYVVAHSMAGAQLVRFLHKHESSKSDTVQSSGVSSASDGAGQDAVPRSSDEEQQSFLRKIKAVAFTDSNHNINWTKTTPSVTNLLVGPSCLYIKSHKPHDEPKALGEPHHECEFWRHRFGEIKTLWAGTHEHALTNYTARYHIWDHFDEFLHPEGSQVESGDSEEDFQTYYGAEGLIE